MDDYVRKALQLVEFKGASREVLLATDDDEVTAMVEAGRYDDHGLTFYYTRWAMFMVMTSVSMAWFSCE